MDDGNISSSPLLLEGFFSRLSPHAIWGVPCEIQFGWALYIGHIFLAKFDDLFRGGLFLFLQNYESLDRFPPVRVRYPYDTGLLNFRMLIKNFLDLPGIDIIPAADDHIFFPVDNVEIALLIHAGDVPGIKPPIAQSLLGLFQPIPIAQHDLGTPDTEFSFFPRGEVFLSCFQVDDLRVYIRAGQSDAADLALPIKGVSVGHGGGFGEAVSLADFCPVNSSKRFWASTGMGAEPELHTRMEEILYFFTRGWLIIAMYMVGTPGKRVGW